jgi:hypothetical protein
LDDALERFPAAPGDNVIWLGPQAPGWTQIIQISGSSCGSPRRERR